jgi:exonuclease VII large subunit
MERGYSVIYQDDNIISKIDDLNIENNIKVSLADGEFNAMIIKDSLKRRG